MSPRITAATAARVLAQLHHDRRTVALLLLVPALLIALLSWVLAGDEQAFDRVAAPMLGLFPFITMFLVTSIAMLRERTGGTLERLMTMPLAKLDLLAGYGVAFGMLATAQAVVVCGTGFLLLGLSAPPRRLARGTAGDRQRAARHVARAVPQRIRPHRVPGGPVHARVRPSPAAPLRALRQS